MFFKNRIHFIIGTILVALVALSPIGQVLIFGVMMTVMSIIYSDTEDVTTLDTFRGEDIWKSYKRDGIYQLKRDLLYGKLFAPQVDEHELFPPWGEPDFPPFTHYSEWDSHTLQTVEVMPKSIKEFHDEPTKWGRIKGVIPKGTKLRMVRVIFRQTIDYHDFYYIAVFVDGPFVGQPVLLNTISKDDYSRTKSYDSNYLEQVKAP